MDPDSIEYLFCIFALVVVLGLKWAEHRKWRC
jgi:hypothetical protein